MKFAASPSRRNLCHDDDDDGATQPSIGWKRTSPVAAPKQQRKRFVRFNETVNQVHQSTKEQDMPSSNKWYSRKELYMFRRDYSELLVTLQHLDEQPISPHTWAGSLEIAYRAFCTYHDKAQDVLLQSLPRVFLQSSLGMERVALRFVTADTVARRRQIYQAVQQWQVIRSTDLRCAMMSDACCDISRPSRLYAHHVARVAAAQGQRAE